MCVFKIKIINSDNPNSELMAFFTSSMKNLVSEKRMKLEKLNEDLRNGMSKSQVATKEQSEEVITRKVKSFCWMKTSLWIVRNRVLEMF